MKFDDIFSYTGEYGRFHKLISLSICSLVFANAFANISTVFISGSMDHYCSPPTEVNCSRPGDDDCWNQTMSLPPDDEGTLLINETQCRMYADDNRTELMTCGYGWTYDRSRYDATIVSEFDLVCEDSYRVSLASSFYLGGFFVGSVVFGLMCDYFGRKRSIFIAFALILLTMMLTGLATSYWFYASSRFLCGATDIGLYLTIFTYVSELVPPSRRAMMTMIIGVYWCVGYMILALMAYFIRSWNTLLLVCSASLSPLLLLYFFIPESARWLLVKGRTEEAKLVVQRIAKWNNAGDLPEEILDNLEIDNETGGRPKETKTRPIEIIRYPEMRKKTVYITYGWFAVNLVYYGLTYGVEGLKVDIYIGTFFGGLTELFAFLFTWFVVQKFGRRFTLAGTLFAGGVACFTNIWIPLNFVELRTSVAMIGKFFITSSFVIVYIYSTELFPTSIRSIGLGVCSFFSRVAAVLAPQILYLEKLWTPLPLVAFSFMAMSSGLVALLLPETLNVPLPQTVEEAELITRQTGRGEGFQDIKLQPVKS